MPTRLSKPTRYRQRKRYYAKHRANATNGGDAWTIEKDQAILRRDMTDAQLSKTIGRSVQAIQIRRSRIKKTT